MTLPAYSWPASGASARGVDIAAFGAGVVIPDWLTPALWPFTGTAFSAPIVLASGTPGLAAAATDAASGVWTVSYQGTLWHQPSAGAATSGAMPSGSVYNGVAFAGAQPYVMAASGNVLTSAAVQIGAFPVPGFALAGSGSMLAALLPASGVGTMTTAGVTGLIALPAGLTVPSCLSLNSGNPLAIAGWQTAPTLSGAIAAALHPIDPTVMLAVGAGRAMLWRAASGLTDAWAQSQIVTGLATLTSVTWAPDGFHAMACSPTSGVIQWLSYVTGVIALVQTLAVTGAESAAIGGDSLHAIVAESGQNQLVSLNNTGTWATGAAVTGVPGVTTVIPYGPSGAVAAYGSGLAFLTVATGIWSITSLTSLAYMPSVLTQDPFGSLYAAGSGQLSIVSPSGVVTASGSWAGGTPTGIAIQQGRLVLAVPPDSLLYEFGNTAPGLWAVQSSGALAAGSTIGLGLSETTLFVMGSASTTMLGFSGTLFVFTNPVSGMAAQRISNAWVTTVLGVGASPSAIGYDTGGNLRVACAQNTIWSINSTTGAVISSGIIPQIPQQNQSVPLGVSALLAFASGMYCATSIPGTLISVA